MARGETFPGLGPTWIRVAVSDAGTSETAGRLAAAQRELARKKRGSSRRKKAVIKVAGLHGKVRRQRLDHAHQTAFALVRDYDLIVHEDLKIGNMTARPKPRPDGSGGPPRLKAPDGQ